MFDRIRSGWELTKKAWGVIRAHPRLAKLPLTGGALALVVFVLVGVPGALVLDGEGGGATAAGVVLLAVGGYLASFVVIYFNVALAAAADQALRGEEPDIPAARRVARSRIRTIAAWALVSAVVSAVLGLLNDRGGIAGRIGAAIGGAIWALVTFLVIPVLALEGVGPIAAVSRSATLIRRRWGQSVTGNFVIGGVSGLITAVGVIAGGVGIFVLATGSVGTAVVGGVLIVVGVLVAVAGAVFGGATRGVFGVALYRYIADEDDVAAIGPFTARELAAAARPR